MADIRLGNLLWKDNTQPNSVSNPVNTKDVNSDSTKAELTAVKNELELVKAELQEIKANQLSGDQKVQLSGTEVEEIVMVHGEGGISHTHLTNNVVSFYPNWSSNNSISALYYTQRWTEASKYKDKLIAIRNRYDVAITLRLYDQTRSWGGDEIFTVEIPAGANAYITALEYPKLTVPAYNLIFESRCASLATEGTLTVRFRGRL